MRKELVGSVQSITSLPQQQKIEQPRPQPPHGQPRPKPFVERNETLLITRVIRESRANGYVKVSLVVCNPRNQKRPPSIPYEAGQRIRITTMPPLPPAPKKPEGDSNAKG